jgi:ribosomal-protein-alanine N-acetyltransferase
MVIFNLLNSEYKTNMADIFLATIAAAKSLQSLHNKIFPSKQWNFATTRAHLAPPYHTFMANNKQGILVGYLTIRIIGDEVEIIFTAVDINHRRQKIGHYLFKHMLGLYPSPPHKIFLETSQHNDGAICFYKQLGFYEMGIRKNYYGEQDNAITMTLAPSLYQ